MDVRAASTLSNEHCLFGSDHVERSWVLSTAPGRASDAMHQCQSTSSSRRWEQRGGWGHGYKHAPEVHLGLLVSELGVSTDSAGEMLKWRPGPWAVLEEGPREGWAGSVTSGP